MTDASVPASEAPAVEQHYINQDGSGARMLVTTISTQSIEPLKCARTTLLGTYLRDEYDGGGDGFLPSKTTSEYELHQVRCVTAAGKEHWTTEEQFRRTVATKLYNWGEKID